MTPLWFTKHQYQVPCLIIAFFDFTFSGGSTEDDKIKADINAIKLALSRSGFRTRFSAVLMSDKSIVQSTEMEERFSAIRRSTSSDAKTGLFFMPPMPSDGEIASFLQGLLTTLQPLCVEYYRDLTKHARRKKSRYPGPSIPALPMHGAAQALSRPGWDARYEIKQAIFAEYRQEMDVAERHYTQVIEELCNAEGLFENMPSWSPRWNETRLLCDSTALRIIRCHLWNGMTTTAAQYWFEYRDRMKSLIDRKGKGTHTYGWLAWETRWARIMAELIHLAVLPMLDNAARPKTEAPVDLSEFHAYARKDRAFESVEAIPPQLMLHHSGYWNMLALRAARARHRSALDIPDEDRTPPGQSPASSVANRAQSYDTYLVPEPHEEWADAQRLGIVDHVQLAHITEQAVADFVSKNQFRLREHLELDLAENLMADESYARAMDVLVPLWDASSWREERWHDLFRRLLVMLNQCSIAIKNPEIALATAWEQLSLSGEHVAEGVADSIASTVGELALPVDANVPLEYHNHERLSPLDVRFAFDEVNAHAGDPIRCQLILCRNAAADTQPLEISRITITFSTQEDIEISTNGELASGDSQTHNVELDGRTGSAPLTISSKQMLILNFTQTVLEAAPVHVQAIKIKFQAEHLHVVQTIDDADLLHAQCTYAMQAGIMTAQDTRHENTTQLPVLPKPPKVDIRLIEPREQYYVGETLSLDLRLFNGEAQNVSGTISSTVSQVDDDVVPSHLSTSDGGEDSIIRLTSGNSYTFVLHIQSVQTATQLAIIIKFSYTLDDGSPGDLVKTLETTIPLMPLLEPKWSFGPLLHPEPWPSYFDPTHHDTAENPSGIPQRWQAAFSAKSLAHETIIVHKAALEPSREPLDAIVSVRPSVDHDKQSVEKDKTLTRAFELTTTKISADDRKPFQLEPLCTIEWSHEHNSTVHTSRIPIPRLTMPSSEPRVLCTITQGEGANASASLQYHLENLSTHFLTFTLTMEASEDFAFMGAKYRTLSLAPLSRRCVPFKIMLYTGVEPDGRWIWPDMKVVDSYYQKTLRIQPAGADVKLDAQNGLGVFVRRLRDA